MDRQGDGRWNWRGGRGEWVCSVSGLRRVERGDTQSYQGIDLTHAGAGLMLRLKGKGQSGLDGGRDVRRKGESGRLTGETIFISSGRPFPFVPCSVSPDSPVSSPIPGFSSSVLCPVESFPHSIGNITPAEGSL